MAKPSAASTTAIQEAASAINPTDATLSNWYGAYIRNHVHRLAVDLDLLLALDPDRAHNILDVGSTPPVLMTALQSEGRDVKGVDIAPERFAVATQKLGLSIARCDIETEALPFASGSFQLVLLNEVFEHLRINLLATMRQLVRVLAPGGMLCLSTPNARSTRGVANFIFRARSGWCGAGDVYGQYEKLELLGHMGHVREYTRNDIARFLERIDLESVAVVWRGVDPSYLYRWTAKVAPSLSPFMSLIMRKANR